MGIANFLNGVDFVRKTYLKETTILSVFDFNNEEKIYIARLLFGICYSDQTYRFVANQRVITSKIKSQNNREFITNSGNCYVSENEPSEFDLSLSEFIVMRHYVFSPIEIMEARTLFDKNNDLQLH